MDGGSDRASTGQRQQSDRAQGSRERQQGERGQGSGERQQTRDSRETDRGEGREESRSDRSTERTEDSDKRQEERSERTEDRQDGLNERQDDRQDFYEDNHWGYGWGGHYHGYYGAGGLWAGLFIGAAIASIPHQHEVVVVTGTTYYYSSGVYYVSSGSGYTVVEAPPGATVQELPEQTVNVNVNVSGETVQYANGTYYEEKPPAEEGAEAAYEVIEPPNGATVPYVPEGAVEKKVGDQTYFVAGTTYYKAFYSGSDVVYMVTENPEG